MIQYLRYSAYEPSKVKSQTWTSVPLIMKRLKTPSSLRRYLSKSTSQPHPLWISHATDQSRKCPASVLARIENAVEFTALDGRRARRVVVPTVPGDEGTVTSLPRLPITCGVFVMLLTLGRVSGRGVRVHRAVVLLQ